jgi:hypothetical protein
VATAAQDRLNMLARVLGIDVHRTCPKRDPLWGSPQGDVELMAEKKVLDFKPAWWFEQIGYEGCKQVDDRKHQQVSSGAARDDVEYQSQHRDPQAWRR